ncbi:major facilitator superfamily protein [Sphingomonas sp. LH128]|uniref:Major facilitator superfamily protein n=1 Tax=Novosphingobium resinovorum TaxID=158500 RepID=A0A031JRZ5_9SPHN|nr:MULTISPECIES: MFS transporter [Sphingomonadaceae]EJU10846.1 major facilitator superfamily protein [Sphingomonas sp. LH128]EZP79568.1 Major facilitator superfamily protein [Novosphingobium resinovorum]
MSLTSHASLDRRSLALAALSTVVEWYDFTLYLYLATVLSRVFFLGEGAVLTALLGFAMAYLMRPVGAMVFGHFGDRHGRRATLLASMTLMTAAMLATALLPTAAQVGSLAGVLLLALRCVMGFAVGGEYTGVVAYLLEGAPRHRRGFVTSLAAATSEIGGLLAAGISALVVSLMPTPVLDGWGWRIPFLFGAALAGVILLARAAMDESPEFAELQAAGALAKNPLGEALSRYRPGVLRGFAISALGSITYYVGITYVPIYLTSSGSLTEAEALQLATIAALAVIVVTPFVGLLSDRVGRRPVLVGLAVLSAALPYALFRLLDGASDGAALAGAVLLAMLAGGVSAVGAVATAEQVPAEGRLSGLALGATTATALFGGLTPWLAQLLTERTALSSVPGVMIAVVAICVLPVLLRLPETRPR